MFQAALICFLGKKRQRCLVESWAKCILGGAGWGKAYRKNCSKFTKEPITAIIWRVPPVLSEVLSWKIAAAWRTEALNIFETACKLLEGLHYVAFFLTPPNSKGFFCCWYFKGFFFGGVWPESHNLVQAGVLVLTLALPSLQTHLSFSNAEIIELSHQGIKRNSAETVNYTFVYTEINSTEDSMS